MDVGRVRVAAGFVRTAGSPDARVVRELDDLAFPVTRYDAQRAEPGELEDGIAAGDIFVFDRDQEVLGYVFVDMSPRTHIYISGIAVRPDVQGRGIGSALMDHALWLLADRADSVPIVTVTSPRNIRMLKTLFRRGFAARWALRNRFGPGRHRFGCQLLTAAGRASGGSADAHRVPVTEAPTRVLDLMEAERLAVRAVVPFRASYQFGMSPIRDGDFLETSPPV